MGIKKRRILRWFQKCELTLVLKCTYKKLWALKVGKNTFLLYKCHFWLLWALITVFRCILSLRQVYIFGISAKFCVFWYPMSPIWEKSFWPLLSTLRTLVHTTRKERLKISINIFCKKVFLCKNKHISGLLMSPFQYRPTLMHIPC